MNPAQRELFIEKAGVSVEFMKHLTSIGERVVTLFPLLLIMTMFMGRRSIGELPVFDFLIMLTLGSLVGAHIADPDIPQWPTVIAVVAIAVLQKIISFVSIKLRPFGKLMTFEPIVVIKDGKMIAGNLRRSRYSVDNILQMLRQQQVFDIANVETAVLEANGKLSVHEKSQPGISYPVVIEGKLQTKVLNQLKLPEEWVLKQLADKGMPLSDVFFATVDEKRKLNPTTYRPEQPSLPPIYH